MRPFNFNTAAELFPAASAAKGYFGSSFSAAELMQ